MPKYFLLVAGPCYYPCSGDGNWIGCFETEEEAKEYYYEHNLNHDWFEIINLKSWMEKEMQ